VCPAGAPTNVTCFSNTPTEVDPTQAGYTGPFTATSANPAVAAVGTCAATPSASCARYIGILVYPQGVGTTTVTVTGANGLSATLPVSVAETNVTISLLDLPAAQSVCIGYVTSAGVAGDIVSYVPIANPASNPTIKFVNIPAPVNVTYTSFNVVVNPVGSGMLTCAQGIAQNTLADFSFAPGKTNQETLTVSPSTQ
jgi:hypothetical protein